MDDEYDIDCTGTEDDMIERETDKALGAGAMSAAAVRGAVGPLVRIILALLAAIGGGSVREALARAKAWTAPVDVEAEVERAANEIREGREALPDRPMTDVIRPLVEDRARLAREVADLTRRLRGAGAAREVDARIADEVVAARAEIAAVNVELTARIAEVVRYGREAEAARAEIARLTAAPGEAWERLREASYDMCQAIEVLSRVGTTFDGAPVPTIFRFNKASDTLRAALAAVEPRVGAVTADPSDIADRLIEAVEDDNGNTYPATVRQRRALVAGVRRMLAAGCQFTDAAVAAIAADEAEESADRFGLFDGFAEVDAALNAIFDGNHGPARTRAVDTITADPSAPVDAAEQAYQPTVEIERVSCSADRCDSCSVAIGLCQSHVRNIPGAPRSLILCPECVRRYPLGTVPPLPPELRPVVVDVTAITHDYRPGAQDGMPRLADVEAREVVPESLATHAEILGGDSRPTIATHEIRREGDSAIVAEQWTDGDKVVKRYEVRLNFSGLVHMALNTTAEERAAIDERADWRGVDDTNTAAPLRALTEAEARTWAAVALRPGGVRVIDVAAAILAASRGDVPPEVRAAVPLNLAALAATVPPDVMAAARAEVRAEMAVTTGGPPFNPDAFFGQELRVYPKDAPTGVPSIAGPAGLDLVSGTPAEYWDKGVAVERQSAAAQCVAVLVTDPADRVLLVHSSKGGDRAWEIPGGKLYPDEDPRAGARREVVEETGLTVVLSTDEPVALPRSARHRGALLFHGRAEGEPRPGSDAKEARWMPPGEVMRLHRGGRLSDLASRDVLLEWARGASSPAAGATTQGPEVRPRVGAWSAWEPACGASIYDDHGLVVASAWETPDGWRWSANRPHLAPVQCSVPVSREEAESAAVIVLETWADVSAARGAQ